MSRMRETKTFAFSLFAVPLLLAAWLFVFSSAQPRISYQRSPELGDEVVVTFGHLVPEEVARISFRIEPEVEGDLVWIAEFRELHFVPRDGFTPGVEYRVSVASASSLLAATIVPDKAFTFAPGAAAVQTIDLTQSAFEKGRYVDINLATMIVTLLENGTAVKTMPVGGKGNPWFTPTREGTFKVLSKEVNHWSTIYHLWMPYAINYSGDYFLHAWPYWPNGAPVNSTYSGGCVRFYDEDAKGFFDWVEIGTPIIIHSTPGRVALFAAENIQDGDLVREESDYRIYVVKHAGENRYKRHVMTEEFADWYPHLSPFWANVKTVPDGALATYVESRWVRTSEPIDAQGHTFVYEIISPGVKHLMFCGDNPETTLFSDIKPEKCEGAWQDYGWDLAELFTVSAEELDAYVLGDAITLPTAPGYLSSLE